MEIAVNQFINGLDLDQHPLTINNTTLTDALNATILTNNGNELMLQNDIGNTLIQDSRTGRIMGLSEGFVPLGMKEYGGVLYIASYNPETEEGELGSIPSPLITYTIGEEQKNNDVSVPLTNDNHTENELYNSTLNNYVKISDCKLKPGDAFYIVLELKRCIDRIKRGDEICGYIEDNELINVPEEQRDFTETDTENLCIKADIEKSIFSCSDLGKGLFDVELYTKTQSHGILPLEDIQNKEVQYYVKKDPQIKNSNYWFIDRCKLQNDDTASNQFDDQKNLNLDMKRSISAESFLNYPNYPSGYLCTKLSPVLPKIDGMLINKSTGIKSPYLYMNSEEKKYTYEDIIIPQFYELNYKEDDDLQSSDVINNWKNDSDISNFLKCTKDHITTIGDLISGKIIFAVRKEEQSEFTTYTLFLLEDDLQTINTFKLGDNNTTDIEYYKFLVYLACENNDFNDDGFASFDTNDLNYITKLLPQFSNYYYIVIPGFYCNSGVLTIDKIKLTKIEKNGALFNADYKTWLAENDRVDGSIKRSTILEESSIQFVAESKKDIDDGYYQDNDNNQQLQPSTFVQIFDINKHKDKSIICPNNKNSISKMLAKRSLNPRDMSTNDNEGLFAFLIGEKDLNSTFKMTFEFYSKVPKDLAKHSNINDPFNWDSNPDDYYECLVLTKDFYYTPRAIQLDSYTVQQADNVQLHWPDENTPELKLKEGVLFGIKDDKVCDYDSMGNTLEPYGKYDCDQMCTAYLYPYIQLKLDNKNRIKGSRVCIGGFTNENSSWASSDYKKGVYRGLTKRTQEPYHFYDNDHKSSSEHTWEDENTSNTLEISKLSALQQKGIYCCNMNWFKNTDEGVVYNKNNPPYQAVVTKDLLSSDIFNSIPHGMLDSSGMVMTVRPTSNFIEKNFNFSNKDNKPSYKCRSSYSKDISDRTAIGVDHRAIKNWVAANIDDDVWYRKTSFPKYDTSGNQVVDGGQFGHNRYLEFLYCCMRTFCEDAPLYTKGFTSTNRAFKNYSNDTWTTTYKITQLLSFKNNLSYLYKKAFKIKIYNKSETLCKFYHLYNNIEEEQDSATLEYKLTYQGAFENNDNINSIIDISSSFKELFKTKDDCKAYDVQFKKITPHSEYQNILSNEFCYNVNVEFSVLKSPHNCMRPGLIGIIPSYQFFLDLDNIKLKKEQKTDRIITPYFNVANTKNQPFNSNLGVEQTRLVSEQTCNQNYWKYEIVSPDSTESMCKHTTSEYWTKVCAGKEIKLEINKTNNKYKGFPSPLEKSMHILKVSGCCLNDNGCDFSNPVRITSCKIICNNDESSSLEFNQDDKNTYKVSDYLMFKIPNGCEYYTVTLKFETAVVIKEVCGFDYLYIDETICKDSGSGFYFTESDGKKQLYPLFPEYYVYCENGIKCANTDLYDIPQYPADPYARIYGYYTINPVNYDTNDYYNSNSPILYDCVKEFYKPENNNSDSIPMQTIKTYSSYYKD